MFGAEQREAADGEAADEDKPGLALKSVPPEPQPDDVTRALLNYLFRSGEVTLGSRIPPERQLAEAFGVSRTAVRESLRLLNLLGLVTMRQGAGTYLVADSLALLPQLMEWGVLLGPGGAAETMEARAEIEMSTVRLAARRSATTPGMVDRLNEALEQLRTGGDDPAGHTVAELTLHRELAAAADNAVMASMVEGLIIIVGPWLERLYGSPDGAAARDGSRWEHQSIVSAVIDGDESEAVDAMNRHLTATVRRLAALPGL